MSCVETTTPAGARAMTRGRRRRRALIALATAAAATITTASVPSPASAQVLPPFDPIQILPPLDPIVTGTTTQLLHLVGGVSRGKLEMIEEEGYICFRNFTPVPPGMSWVCIPPIQ